MKRDSHWEREKSGRLTAADLRHESKESWGWEVKEHGLTMREGERAMLQAQRKKYAGKPKSKFHLGAKNHKAKSGRGRTKNGNVSSALKRLKGLF